MDYVTKDSVIVPHGSCFFGSKATGCGTGMVAERCLPPFTYDDWIAMDLELVSRCDAVLRLPGESVGADMETAFACSRSIPVYYSVEQLCKGI